MHVMKKIVLQALDVKTSHESENNAQQQPEPIRDPPSTTSSNSPIAVSAKPPTGAKEKERATKIAKRQSIAETKVRSPTIESEMPILKRKAKTRLETVKEAVPDSHKVIKYYEQDSPGYATENTKKQQAQKIQKATQDAVKTSQFKATEKPFTMKEHLKTVADTYEYSPLVASYDSELSPMPRQEPKRSNRVVKISPIPADLRGKSGGRASDMSQLSSGFGSLQDEGSGTVLQDEENEEWNPRKSALPPSSEDYLYRGEPQNTRGNPPHVREASMHVDGHIRQPWGPLTGSDIYSKQQQQSPIQAWTTPDILPRQHKTSSVNTSSDERRGILAEKQETLQHSKMLEQKLAKNVQLLDYKVAEEQLS